MNYLKQINDYWEKSRKTEGMTPHTQSLYFALLYFANKFRKTKFNVYRDDILEVSFVSKNTYYKARDFLKQNGFIDFSDGPNPLQKTYFSILTVSQFCDTEEESVSQAVSQAVSQKEDANPKSVSQNCDTHNKHKVNININSIEMPFKDEEFIIKWQEWITYRHKEKKKPYKNVESQQRALDKLSRDADGNIKVAIEMLDRAMVNNYQGFFPLKDWEIKKLENNGHQQKRIIV